jgi:DNA-binding NarL/FixJ family response regulator
LADLRLQSDHFLWFVEEHVTRKRISGEALLAPLTKRISVRVRHPVQVTSILRLSYCWGGSPPGLSPLTQRQHAVALLVGQGSTNRQIAERLVITERTAGAHIEHILDKLGFSSRTQIGVWVAGNVPADSRTP